MKFTTKPACDGSADGYYWMRQADGYTTPVCVDTSVNGREQGTFVYTIGSNEHRRLEDVSDSWEWCLMELPDHPDGTWNSYKEKL